MQDLAIDSKFRRGHLPSQPDGPPYHCIVVEKSGPPYHCIVVEKNTL